MDAQDKIAVVNRYVEAFENSDMSIIREMYADDAVVEDPVGSEPFVGIDAILAFYQGALDSGAKLQITGNPRCAANAVAFPFKVVMAGMEIEVIDIFEFDDAGKVASMRAYWGG